MKRHDRQLNSGYNWVQQALEISVDYWLISEDDANTVRTDPIILFSSMSFSLLARLSFSLLTSDVSFAFDYFC